MCGEDSESVFHISHHLKAIALHHVGSRYSRVVVLSVFLTNRAP